VGDITKIYEEIQKGKRKKFPQGSWDDEGQAIIMVKYLLEEKLKWGKTQVCRGLDTMTFRKHGLGGMLYQCFNNSVYEAVSRTYPNEYKRWELSRTPNGFWTSETGIEATKWLLEEKLKWSREEICDRLRRETFLENGLSGMLLTCYENSPFKALIAAYPGEYTPEDVKCTPRNYTEVL